VHEIARSYNVSHGTISRLTAFPRFSVRTRQILRSAKPISKSPDRLPPANISPGKRSEHFTAILPGFPE
jgi:hypothetical protein